MVFGFLLGKEDEMKNIFLILFLALIYSNASALENEPIDFRGVKFGRDIKFNKNMSLVKEDLDYYVYKKDNDELKFNGVDLIAIYYSTTKGKRYGGYLVHKDGKHRLWGVTMAFKGVDNYNRIRDYLNRKHGKGSDLTKKDLDKVKSIETLSDRTPSTPKKGCIWKGDGIEMRLFYGLAERVDVENVGCVNIIHKQCQKWANPVFEVMNFRNVKPIEENPNYDPFEKDPFQQWKNLNKKPCNPLFKCD